MEGCFCRSQAAEECSCVPKRVQSYTGENNVVSEDSELTMSALALESSLESSSSAVGLPPEILAIVLSKLPFPEIFRIKLLSRYWYFKLPSLRPVKSLDCQEDQKAFILPQVDVSSECCTLCPVFLSGSEIVGYDRIYRRWRKMPVHHRLLEPLHKHLLKFAYHIHGIKFAGPLIIVYQIGLLEYTGIVANALLGTWKTLSGFPTFHESCTVANFGPEDYKVVIHNPWQHSDGYVRFRTRVFDSKSQTWRRGESILRSPLNSGVVDYGRNVMDSAFLNGNVYCMLTSGWSKTLELWQYSIEKEVWTKIPVDLNFGDIDYSICGLFAVASQILVVIMVDKSYSLQLSTVFSECALVYCLDMRTMQLSEPWRSPPMQAKFCPSNWYHSKVVSDSECLYFLRRIVPRGEESFAFDIWSFHVSSKTWESVPAPPVEYSRLCEYSHLAEGAFAPCLNPCSAP